MEYCESEMHARIFILHRVLFVLMHEVVVMELNDDKTT